MREACLSALTNWADHLGEGVSDPLAEEVVAAVEFPNSTTWLAEHDRVTRLEEAEWWEHLAQGHHGNSYKGETCEYCQRLAALRKEPTDDHS